MTAQLHVPVSVVSPPAVGGAEAYAALAWIEEFVRLARCAIEEEDDEALRRRYEDEVLRRAAFLRAAGLFDIVRIDHPGLRAMVDDAAR
ncbi:hypothetical protein [Luteimonas huabeiensis]|uniref:hypothetical protein n=1 Tax=Luteimonas huabeiensis TaxID=1244513 RepID=UPI001268FC32|nr:hypothetical protein [Luteimonas huabeiensis]